MTGNGDYVDRLRAEWRDQLPDLDTTPVAVVNRVQRLAGVFSRELSAFFAEHGLSDGGFAVLSALRRAGPPFRRSPGDLHRSLLLSSAAMTNRLDRLETSGLVRRISDPDDRRALLVELTEEGRARVEDVARRHVANEARLLEPLTAAERDRLAELLRILLIAHEEPSPER